MADAVSGDEQAGGPGADIRADDDDQEPQDSARIFTASLGEETLELTVGQEKELTLSIERGEEFTQNAVAFVKAPRGISAVPDEMGFELGQQEGKILLTPTSDALVGDELAVEVEFRPETGASVRKQLLVTVIESQ